MPRIQVYDTTLRDGSQGEGISFSLHDKLIITERLDSLGFDFIEGGYPLSNEKDAQYFQRVGELKLKQALVCAFGMTRRRGVLAQDDPGMRALLDSQAPVITIVGKTSDFHVREVLRVSLEENLAMIEDSVRYLREAGRRVIYDAEHFFDGWKANPEYAARTIRAAAAAGAETVVLCDTNGGSMPEEIAALTREAISVLDVPVGIHCHNDSELAVANSLASIDAGARHVQGTINGFGERCGNADLISIIANLGSRSRTTRYWGAAGSNISPNCRASCTKRRTCASAPTSRLSARAPSPIKGACTCMPSRAWPPATSTSPRSGWATNAGCWSANCRAGRTSWP